MRPAVPFNVASQCRHVRSGVSGATAGFLLMIGLAASDCERRSSCQAGSDFGRQHQVFARLPIYALGRAKNIQQTAGFVPTNKWGPYTWI
jgi:hypothetical protein